MSTNEGIEINEKLQQSCYICSYVFQNTLELKYHLSDTHKLRQCHLCYKYIDCNKNRLKRHLEYFHSTEVHQCNICNKIYPCSYSLRDHVCIKNFEPKLKCEYCGNVYHYNRQLKAHISSAHNNFSVTCEKCGKISSKRHSKRHIKYCKANGVFKCDECGQIFDCQNDLYQHFRKQHNQDEEKVICDICGKNYEKRRLNTHKKLHFNTIKCSVCGRDYANRQTLKIHILKAHSNEPYIKIKNYKCKLCFKKFMNKLTLEEHMDIHFGIRKYKCTICEKTFGNQRNLDTHVVTHSGIKEFFCQQCSSSYFTKRALAWHIKCKHGEFKGYYDERNKKINSTIGKSIGMKNKKKSKNIFNTNKKSVSNEEISQLTNSPQDRSLKHSKPNEGSFSKNGLAINNLQLDFAKDLKVTSLFNKINENGQITSDKVSETLILNNLQGNSNNFISKEKINLDLDISQPIVSLNSNANASNSSFKESVLASKDIKWDKKSNSKKKVILNKKQLSVKFKDTFKKLSNYHFLLNKNKSKKKKVPTATLR